MCDSFSNLKKMKHDIQWTQLIWTPRGQLLKCVYHEGVHTKRALRYKVIRTHDLIDKQTKADISKTVKCLNFTLTYQV